MAATFRHACVVVKDLKRALRFYRDILGLEVSKVLKVKGRYPETLLGVKGIKLAYVKMRDGRQPKNSPPIFELHCWRSPKISSKRRGHVSFTIDELDNEYKRLRSLGVKFISKPAVSPDGATKVCFGYDPDGNLIEFMEDLKSA